MKKKLDKKRTRILSRFCALLSSLLLCMCLTVPAFASNNASTEKWYVADEDMKLSESGKLSRYLKITPYIGGEVYSTYITTAVSVRPLYVFANYVTSGGSSASEQTLAYPIYPLNYPDWWRSALPLGRKSYIEVELVNAWAGVFYWSSALDASSYGVKEIDSIAFHAFSKTDCVELTASTTYRDTLQSSSVDGSVSFTSSTLATFRDVKSTSSVSYPSIPRLTLSKGSSTLGTLSEMGALVPSAMVVSQLNYSSADSYEGISWATTVNNNLSSDDLVLAVSPTSSTGLETVDGDNCGYYSALVNISFWVDANKLPAGLEVGDEFPANNDAFEALREDLIEQFPESEEHINNDKADWEGLRDAETIPEDAANSFFELLGGVFQIDMFATIALMVCGFTALLILTRKAMN